MGSKLQKFIFATFIIAIAAIVYALNYFTPLASDDWNYVFIFGTNDYIHNLWDVIKSQYIHYLEWNGRVLVHTLVQTVDSFLDKGIFNILNTLVFIAFLYVVTINVSSQRKLYHKIILAAFVLIFLLIPEFNMTCLWLCGAFNYLWTATLLLTFHYLLENKNYSNKVTLALLFLYGVICGWSNEAFVVGMAGAYLIYYAINRKSLTRHKAVMLAGFFLGALMLVVSPGSIYRATSNVGIHNKQELLQLLLSMENLRITYLAIIVIPLLAIIKQIRLGEFLKREMWLVIAIAISVLFILATTHHSGHSRMGIELFSLMLLCRALPWEKISGIAISTATVAALIVGVFAVEACEKCYRANEDEFAQIRRHEYPIKTHLPVHDNYLSRFIVPYSYNVMGIDFKTYGTDEFTCKYFHNDSIYFLPAQFVSATKDDPKRLDTFQTEDSWPFYAKRENKENGDSEMTYAMIEYSPYPYSSLNWPLRIIAPKLPGYNCNQVPVKIQRVTLDGSCYILVEKNPDMTFRLKKITLMR